MPAVQSKHQCPSPPRSPKALRPMPTSPKASPKKKPAAASPKKKPAAAASGGNSHQGKEATCPGCLKKFIVTGRHFWFHCETCTAPARNLNEQCTKAGQLEWLQNIRKNNQVEYKKLLDKYNSECPPPGRGGKAKSFDVAGYKETTTHTKGQNLLADFVPLTYGEYIKHFMNLAPPDQMTEEQARVSWFEDLIDSRVESAKVTIFNRVSREMEERDVVYVAAHQGGTVKRKYEDLNKAEQVEKTQTVKNPQAHVIKQLTKKVLDVSKMDVDDDFFRSSHFLKNFECLVLCLCVCVSNHYTTAFFFQQQHHQQQQHQQQQQRQRHQQQQQQQQ